MKIKNIRKNLPSIEALSLLASTAIVIGMPIALKMPIYPIVKSFVGLAIMDYALNFFLTWKFYDQSKAGDKAYSSYMNGSSSLFSLAKDADVMAEDKSSIYKLVISKEVKDILFKYVLQPTYFAAVTTSVVAFAAGNTASVGALRFADQFILSALFMGSVAYLREYLTSKPNDTQLNRCNLAESVLSSAIVGKLSSLYNPKKVLGAYVAVRAVEEGIFSYFKKTPAFSIGAE